MKHYLIIDLEATCSKEGTIARDKMELIERGSDEHLNIKKSLQKFKVLNLVV